MGRKIKAGTSAGCCDKDGYIVIQYLGHQYRAATLAWYFMTGELITKPDHKNRIPYDDSFENLRPATSSQNNANRFCYNPTGFRGVIQIGSRYRASIKYQGVKYHLGMYDTPEEASARYKQVAQELFGDFIYE